MLDGHGFDLYAGVPCSLLGTWLSLVVAERAERYVAATNEGEAVAIAVGATLAGRRPVVFLQNSGLGNGVNPLTSLAHAMGVPLLLVVGHRGAPGTTDEPQHRLMGEVTVPLLESIGCAVHRWDPEVGVRDVIDAAVRGLAAGMSQAVLVPAGVLDDAHVPHDRTSALPRRFDYVQEVARVLDDLPGHVVTTTGRTGRELESLAPRPSNLYMVGSMGCAPSLVLGMAMSRPEHRFVVLDGDGALLMRLEALVAIGQHAPVNLLHLVVDNGAYESTGAQPSSSAGVRFEDVALACGYRSASSSASAESAGELVTRFLRGGLPGPHLARLLASTGGAPSVGRPRMTPVEQAELFRRSLTRA